MRQLIFLALFPFYVFAECLPSESPNLTHIDQKDIIANKYSFTEITKHGEMLFSTKANACDGLGRPATTGHEMKREAIQPMFTRVSGPDSNTCFDLNTSLINL